MLLPQKLFCFSAGTWGVPLLLVLEASPSAARSDTQLLLFPGEWIQAFSP